MRLICGVVQLDGALAEAGALSAMFAALTSPGQVPRAAIRVDGPAALGVLEFSRYAAPGDAPQGTLPQGPDGTWLAGDLRLDRPRELAETLGLPPGTGLDLLTLGAIRKWGNDVPDRLHGDFALAAWDPRQLRLLCARSIMGARPLCYTHRPGRLFAFASLPRGLHASGVASRKLDMVALGRLQVQFAARDHLTGFEEIARLPAGHSLVATPDGIRLHGAWHPDPNRVGCWRGSATEAAATLRNLIEEAVACRLPMEGPVAAHLSGGLDSSAVAVIAARELRTRNRKLHAFSQLARPFPGAVVRDEREYVDAVLAQEPDIDWSPVYLPSLDEEGTIDPDLPLAGPAAGPDDWICGAASRAGTGMLLSGAGGDEGASYNGSGLWAALLRQGQWRSLPAELRARARREKRSLARVAAGQLIAPFLPGWFYGAMLRIRPRPGQFASGARRRNAIVFLNASMAKRVIAAMTPLPVWNNRVTDRIQMLTGSYLIARADRWSIIGARHGIAFSYPLVDRRILDFALSLPLERFVDQGFNRQPYRNAMGGILPECIRWRATKFLPFPDMPANLANAGAGLLARLERLRGCAAATEMFDMDAIAAALSAASAHAADLGMTVRTVGQAPVPHWALMANHAMNALILGEYLARFSP
jgi:asparagine synthase (glutamine-hydrolysing)